MLSCDKAICYWYQQFEIREVLKTKFILQDDFQCIIHFTAAQRNPFDMPVVQ
jgi:hypothetical protein